MISPVKDEESDTPASRRLRRLMYIGFGALAFGLLGFVVALSAGSHIDSWRGNIGVVMVVVAIGTGVIITPVGMILSFLDTKQRRREKREVDREIVRAAMGEASPDESARGTKSGNQQHKP